MVGVACSTSIMIGFRQLSGVYAKSMKFVSNYEMAYNISSALISVLSSEGSCIRTNSTQHSIFQYYVVCDVTRTCGPGEICRIFTYGDGEDALLVVKYENTD